MEGVLILIALHALNSTSLEVDIVCGSPPLSLFLHLSLPHQGCTQRPCDLVFTATPAGDRHFGREAISPANSNRRCKATAIVAYRYFPEDIERCES